jgi:hypothetical protein
MIRGDYYEKPIPVLWMSNHVHAPMLIQPLTERWDGLADACYECIAHSDGISTYRFLSLRETMPPLPPQLRDFSESRRLPMMDEHGYSAALEAEQREREWVEWDAAHG